MKLFKCSVCNYMIESDRPANVCLKCGAPSSAFQELSEEESEKVYDSERTNDILMELDSLAMKISELCYEGIEIDFDPNCIKLFNYSNDKVWEIKQLVKAEIENHIKRKEW